MNPEGVKKMKRASTKRRGCRVLCTALAMAAALTGCALFPKEEEEDAPVLVKPAEITYQTQDVVKGEVVKSLRDTAAVRSVKEYDLAFEERGGYLGSWEVKAGDTVKKGQRLASLDVDSIESEIERQKISVERAQISYNKVKRTSSDEDDLRLAQLDLQEQKLILQQLQNELAKSTLVSPIDGVVTYVASVKVGDNVSARQLLVTVSDSNHLQILYSGSQKSSLSIGQEVQIYVNSTKAQGTGKVVMTPQSAIEAGSSDETEKESAIIEADDSIDLSEVGIGASVTIVVVLDQRQDVLVVPTSAVETTTTGSVVYVLEDGMKVERTVEVGLSTTTATEIVSGLSEGEKVVVK